MSITNLIGLESDIERNADTKHVDVGR